MVERGLSYLEIGKGISCLNVESVFTYDTFFNLLSCCVVLKKSSAESLFDNVAGRLLALHPIVLSLVTQNTHRITFSILYFHVGRHESTHPTPNPLDYIPSQTAHLFFPALNPVRSSEYLFQIRVLFPSA